MEMSQSPEIMVSPLYKNILSAVESVKLAAQQGREKAAEKMSGVKIGMLGLTVGAAFFLAACSGEGAPAGITGVSFSPTPVAEIQTPSSESPPVELVAQPTKKELFQQDIDTLVSTVKGFLYEDYFKRMGYDLDKIADNLKNPDDTTDTTRLVLDLINKEKIDAGRIRHINAHPLQFTSELPFAVSIERDKQTGETTSRHTAFYTDRNGNLLTSDWTGYSPETQDDFKKLLGKLSGTIKMPDGSKPGSTLEDLEWNNSSVSEGGWSMSTVIDSDQGNTVISLHGVANGLNLVSVSFFAHSASAPKK